jgi:hypothetical protein
MENFRLGGKLFCMSLANRARLVSLRLITARKQSIEELSKALVTKDPNRKCNSRAVPDVFIIHSTFDVDDLHEFPQF